MKLQRNTGYVLYLINIDFQIANYFYDYMKDAKMFLAKHLYQWLNTID